MPSTVLPRRYPFALSRAVVLAGAFAVFIAGFGSGAARAESLSVMARMEDALNAKSSVLRYMAAECVQNGVAAALFGSSTGLSTTVLGVLGCGAGALGAAASAGVIYVWEDPDALPEVMTAPITTVWNALPEQDEWSIVGLLSTGTQYVVASVATTTTMVLASLFGGDQEETTQVAEVPARQPTGPIVPVSYQADATPPASQTRWRLTFRP